MTFWGGGKNPTWMAKDPGGQGLGGDSCGLQAPRGREGGGLLHSSVAALPWPGVFPKFLGAVHYSECILPNVKYTSILRSERVCHDFQRDHSGLSSSSAPPRAQSQPSFSSQNRSIYTNRLPAVWSVTLSWSPQVSPAGIREGPGKARGQWHAQQGT